MQTVSRSGNTSLLWAAAVRAQIAHLLLFVLVPLLSVLMRVMFAIVFMPFFLLGGGDRNVQLGAPMSHLHDPRCWIALAPCAAADRTLFTLGETATPPRNAAVRPTPSASANVVDPLPVTWRHAWFLAWLAWFLVYLLHRERLQAPP